MLRVALACAAQCAALALSSRHAFGVDIAQPTLDDVINGIRASEQLLFESGSLFLKYERTASKTVTPTSYSGGLLPAEWQLAYKGGKWFSERRFTEPTEKRTDQVWIPAQPTTQVVKDETALEWMQFAKSAAINRLKAGPNIYAGLLYTRNLHFDAPRYIARSNGADIASVRKQYADEVDLPFLPAFLEDNKARYRVAPVKEDFDGKSCWVVEWPGMDRIWIDPARGFAVPRREYTWGQGKPLRYAIRNHDYREVKPGLWLPFREVEDRYASIISEKESVWGKIAATTEYHLIEVEFNNVPESLFEVRLPPGTQVADMIRDFRYTVSGQNDTDPFTAEIEKARREGAGIVPPKRTRLWMILAANALVAVAIVSFWALRRIRSMR